MRNTEKGVRMGRGWGVGESRMRIMVDRNNHEKHPGTFTENVGLEEKNPLSQKNIFVIELFCFIFFMIICNKLCAHGVFNIQPECYSTSIYLPCRAEKRYSICLNVFNIIISGKCNGARGG